MDTFLGNESFFYNVLEALQSLPDLEKMLSGLTVKPLNVDKATITSQHTSKGIASLIGIKTTLQKIPRLVLSLKAIVNSKEGEGESFEADAEKGVDEGGNSNCDESRGGLEEGSSNQHQLANTICDILSAEELGEVLQVVQDTFTESTVYTKNTHAMRHQECFALRPNTDGMMDVLRKAFLANVDDIYSCADHLAETFDITVSVRVKSQRGYYLSIPIEYAGKLPKEILQPVKCGKFIHCTTHEVFSLNARAQENVQDLLLLTHHRIQEVLNFARDRIEALASMADAIALLDMCHSFSDVVASSRKTWSRPVVTQSNGSLDIKAGRYAIDFENNPGSISRDIVTNDVFSSSPFDNFILVSGVNGGGKSTYLKQIGLIVVLAQIGSYVPAEKALIPLRDMICTRIVSSKSFTFALQRPSSSPYVLTKSSSYSFHAIRRAPTTTLSTTYRLSCLR